MGAELFWGGDRLGKCTQSGMCTMPRENEGMRVTAGRGGTKCRNSSLGKGVIPGDISSF